MTPILLCLRVLLFFTLYKRVEEKRISGKVFEPLIRAFIVGKLDDPVQITVWVKLSVIRFSSAFTFCPRSRLYEGKEKIVLSVRFLRIQCQILGSAFLN